MQFLYTSFLSQQQNKTGQTPSKGAKVLPKKSTKKAMLQAKEKAKVPRALTEEEKIIQAAEKYHQQISGKKAGNTPAPATQSALPATQKTAPAEQTALPASQNAAPLNKKNFVIPSSQRTTSDQSPQKNDAPAKTVIAPSNKKAILSAKTEKKTGAAFRKVDTKSSEIQVTAEERELSMNIFSGNPGMYQTEGDTLNFWSLSPLPIDTLSHKIAIVEQPGKPYGFVGKPMKAMGQDWTFFLILIGWTIFASLRFGFSKYIVQVFQSIFNFTIASRLYREQGYNNNFGPFRLNLIFYLFLPFPIYLIAKDNGVSLMGYSGIELFGMVLVVVNAYFLLKIFLYKILGSVFSQKEITGELVFNMMLYHNVLGMIMLPIATIHSMVPALGFLAIFIVPGFVLVFYLLSIVRSIYYSIRTGISIFYLILYLCALEILPILLVVKLATGQ